MLDPWKTYTRKYHKTWHNALCICSKQGTHRNTYTHAHTLNTHIHTTSRVHANETGCHVPKLKLRMLAAQMHSRTKVRTPNRGMLYIATHTHTASTHTHLDTHTACRFQASKSGCPASDSIELQLYMLG